MYAMQYSLISGPQYMSATQTKNGFCTNPVNEKYFSPCYKAWKLRCTWVWKLCRRSVIDLLFCILLGNPSQTGGKGRNKNTI